MQNTSQLFVIYLFFARNISSNIMQKSTDDIKLRKHVVHHPTLDTSIRCPNGLKSNERHFDRKNKFEFLVDIESIEDTHLSNNTFWKGSDNLFFIESSGKNHLRPRDACAIESAIRNSGVSGRIIVAMTSKGIDIMANNATCQIYTKYAERSVFFRHVNTDTIFQTTPLHELHAKGHLKSHEEKNTIIQYRYNSYRSKEFYPSILFKILILVFSMFCTENIVSCSFQ